MAEFRVKDDVEVEGTYRSSSAEGVFEVAEGESVVINDENAALVAVATNDANLERVDEVTPPVAEDEAVPVEAPEDEVDETTEDDSPTNPQDNPSVDKEGW